ncbi:hypothetical protein BKA70DRAFT_1540534 [Coprinopsis sp. MPI-PUGE-AT-0042]|nr:hypothetical protein BKA70DRAFT_1540534 [Coprinopsis sp. MPI-PUGE-AT-0042]
MTLFWTPNLGLSALEKLVTTSGICKLVPDMGTLGFRFTVFLETLVWDLLCCMLAFSGLSHSLRPPCTYFNGIRVRDLTYVALAPSRTTKLVHNCIRFNVGKPPRDDKTRFYPSSVPFIARPSFSRLFEPANIASVAQNMTSVFTIKFKKTQGGPHNEEAEFELVDATTGVQRRVDWQSVWGFGNFVRLQDARASTC